MTPKPLAYLLDGLDSRLFLSLALLGLVYPICLVIYRLVFSELAKFPGPKIAAATAWYEFYYDIVNEGKYLFEIEKMHRQYGPIVRINPYELSINDPEAYKLIYVSDNKRRTDALSGFINGIGIEDSILETVPHDLHRRRRKPLEPFFSRLGVSRLQDMLAEVVDKLAGRIEALKGTPTVVRLDHAFSAYAGDVVGRICWEDKEEFLDDPDFSPTWANNIHMIIWSTPLFAAFPFLLSITKMIPLSIVERLLPSSQSFTGMEKIVKEHISEARQAKEEHDRKGTKMDIKASVFRYVMGSDMPESERSDERLTHEGMVFFAGGTATTARTLTFICYYIISRPDVLARLQEELKDTMAAYPERVPSWAELERLPYLQAIIKEGLRRSYGVMHRLPRCSPDVPIQYKEWTIPKNVPVGMSAYFMHNDSSVYPNPLEFTPERWLGDIDPAMTQQLVPFAKGSRNCIGSNLALSEINLALAVLFRPAAPRMRLYETDESDVLQVHDFLNPLPKLDSLGVRVLVG